MEIFSLTILTIGAAFLGAAALRLRPRRLAVRRQELDTALVGWRRLVDTTPGLVLRERAQVVGTLLEGTLRERPLRVEVLAGGGGGAEAEFTTRVALSPRFPFSSATQMWRRGQQPPTRRGPRVRVAYMDVLVEGPDARFLRESVQTFGRLMREIPGLHIAEGQIRALCPDLCPDLDARLPQLEALARALEADLRRPWLREARRLGLALVRQGSRVRLEGRRAGNLWHLSVALVAEGTLVAVHLPLPEDTAIRRRRPREVVPAVGNPIADTFLRVEGRLARRCLRTAAGTAAAMAVLHAWPLSRVSAEGIHLLATGDAIRGGSLVALAEAAEALAACLSAAYDDGDGDDG